MRKYLVLAFVGLILFAAGFGFKPFIDKIIRQQINENLILEPRNQIYSEWVNPSVPIYRIFHMFNLTNPAEVLSGEKPALVEFGPYVYRDYQVKFNVSFSSDGTHASYKQHTYYAFDENKTRELNAQGVHRHPDKDIICTANLPYFAVVDRHVREPDNIEVNLALKVLPFIAQPIKSLTVSELLWGYSDDLIKLLHTFKQLPTDRLSLQFNNSAADATRESIVHTGRGNISRVGEFIQWDGNGSIFRWNSPYADMVNGTEGYFFRPDLDDVENLTLFVPDIFRSSLVQQQRSITHHGIHTLRYVIPQWELLNASQYPPNKEWFSFGPSGLLNLSSSYFGAPVFVSKPYFLDGADTLKDGVIMVGKPDESDREQIDTFLDVEPITGVTVNVAKRLQASILVQPSSKPSAVAKMRKTYLPVLWATQSAAFSSSKADEFKRRVYMPLTIVFAVRLTVIILGAVLFVLSAGCCVRRYRPHARFVHRLRTSAASDSINSTTAEEKAALLQKESR